MFTPRRDSDYKIYIFGTRFLESFAYHKNNEVRSYLLPGEGFIFVVVVLLLLHF